MFFGDFAKIIAVAFAFLLINLAELSFESELYYAVQCAALSSIALISIFLGAKTKSKILMMYALVYIIGGLSFALMLIPSLSFYCDLFLYGGTLNFSLIISVADCFIITTGGINAIFRFYCLRRFGSSGDDFFDARMGLYKWAR
ncbi:MAG: hypothetical protein ABJG42_24805 [Vibrio splendidus]